MRKLSLACLTFLCPALLPGQGFGALKKNVVLERKLPAAVKLPGNSFDVKVTAERPQDPCQKLAADKLQALVETNLVRFNSQLELNPEKPDTLIVLKVLICSALATQEHDTLPGGKKKEQISGVKMDGHLQLTYQARTRGGKFIDAEPIDVKYKHEFNQVTGAISETKKILGKIPHPGGAKHRDEEAEDDPQTLEDLIGILVDRAAQHVAARLVNTNERVTVSLARGSLDQNNRYADAGQWTTFVENLETMPPLTHMDDDAYRLYNIGVGDEALGYKAETPASAKRYFEKAVIQYRKAGEANPAEKYFIEPVNRIEIALEHYKALAAPPAAPASKTAPPTKGKNN